MSLLSLLVVFVLEQWQPLNYRRWVAEPVEAWAEYIEAQFNAGERQHGIIAWCLAVGLPVLALAGIYFFLCSVNPVLAFLLNVVVLYLTMGFRQFSHHFTEIQVALRLDDLPRARKLLGEWLHRPTGHLPPSEISRLAIESALIASHRHVFAVLLWFLLLPGPCGALLYRLAALTAEVWQKRDVAQHNNFSAFSQRVFGIIEWLPVRVTASAFAIVGDFEDAVYCWRTQASVWSDKLLGIVLASGAGALGVVLGTPVVQDVDQDVRVELGLGDPPDVDFMQSAVGLVWRATVLWMLLLFLLGLATLAG